MIAWCEELLQMSVGVGDLKNLVVTTIFLTEKIFHISNLEKKIETKNIPH